MYMRVNTTAEDVEHEIARLRQSEYVKLSFAEQRMKMDKRRKYLADLRWHEKRGRQLADMGITRENMDEMLFGGDDGEDQ